MRPLGMTGTRKLQDLFVDRKTPRRFRQHIPIVVDAADQIVWVAGHAVGEDFRVTPATSDVVILKLKYWRNGT
jgi:tRNA(Ile)-lysidine synthase